VLHYRSLIHGVAAARYWDWGDDDKEFKWNNYLSRYHTRHLDLMDVLAMYQPRANAPLDDMAKLCGFPGKLGMDGSRVLEAFQNGGIDAIRNYCETDVMNTWLVYLRFQKARGTLDEAAYAAEIALARSTVAGIAAPHWQEFLAAWA
jgi:predicted PolB exonuclease-like 3'-5' exonuclease